MIKDKAIEELFLAQKPVFNDQDAFMQNLERKLEAIEYIKQYEEANLRRYKLAIAVAFLLGLASGGALLFFMLDTPLDVPLFTFNETSHFLSGIQKHSRMIAIVVLIITMGYGVINVVNNILDISKMKSSMRMYQNNRDLSAI